MDVISTTLTELYRIFEIINQDRFNSRLPTPVITIQKTRNRTLGYFTECKVWSNVENQENETFYEINIDPRYFHEKSAIDITETLIHEMVRYDNKLAGIKDCSRKIHNKKFKESAERVGLIVEKDSKLGWGITSLSEELSEYIKNEVKPDESCFKYFRLDDKEPFEKKKKKKTMFKYTCPECGLNIKAKPNMKVSCVICEKEFIMEEKPDEDIENIENVEGNENDE